VPRTKTELCKTIPLRLQPDLYAKLEAERAERSSTAPAMASWNTLLRLTLSSATKRHKESVTCGF